MITTGICDQMRQRRFLSGSPKANSTAATLLARCLLLPRTAIRAFERPIVPNSFLSICVIGSHHDCFNKTTGRVYDADRNHVFSDDMPRNCRDSRGLEPGGVPSSRDASSNASTPARSVVGTDGGKEPRQPPSGLIARARSVQDRAGACGIARQPGRTLKGYCCSTCCVN